MDSPYREQPANEGAIDPMSQKTKEAAAHASRQLDELMASLQQLKVFLCLCYLFQISNISSVKFISECCFRFNSNPHHPADHKTITLNNRSYLPRINVAPCLRMLPLVWNGPWMRLLATGARPPRMTRITIGSLLMAIMHFTHQAMEIRLQRNPPFVVPNACSVASPSLER